MTKLNSQQEQVIIGTVLGDGGLYIRDGGKCNALFKVTHREADKEYLFWKYEMLKSSGIFLRPPSRRLKKARHEGGHVYFHWKLSSRRLPIFTAYHKMFYPNGKKIVTQEILDRLEPLGLAVWYMDDGSLVSRSPRIRKSGIVHLVAGRNMSLSTMGFTYEENVLIRGWILERFNILFRVSRHYQLWGLRLGRRAEVNKFLDIIRPYLVPCMERKFKEEKVNMKGVK